MASNEEITDIYKKLSLLSSQNTKLQEDIAKLVQHDTYQAQLINHQREYLSSLGGQINLLLQFIISEPSNLLRFADFAKTAASNTTDTQKEMKAAAQWLLDNGLQRFVSQSPENPSSHPVVSSPANTNQAGLHQFGGNVIQFPGPQKNDAHDP